MTVSSQTSRVSYAGNGSTTAFAVSFYFLADSHLKVILRAADGSETVKTLTADYTVSGAGNPSGGTVTMNVAPTSGATLVIVRNVPLTQETDYQANDDFPAESHERALDKLTMEVQQLQEQVDRSAKLPVTNPTDADALVADIVRLADSADNIDTVANNIGDVNTVSDDIANVNTVADDIAHVNTVATDIAAVITVANDLNEPVSEIEVVAGAITNVNTVGNNIASVNTVAANISNVNAVAGNSTNINAVNANKTNIDAVAGNATNINAVNANKSNIDAVAGNASNINAAVANAANINTAVANMPAIIAAPTEAANAAASAAAAAASAASGMYSAVQDKSADYTVVVGDAGDLIRMTTTGGARTVTLPAISTLPDGFNVTVVKWTGDTNDVTVTRSGSDTINGSTSYVLDAQYKSATFVADKESSTWFASGSGSSSTNIIVDSFNGTGSQTAFMLSGDPGTENNTQVFVGGVYQEKDTYSMSGSTLTFSSAPPAGTSNIEVVWSQPLAIGVPADATVSTIKLADSAVTTAKMADESVTTSKVQDSAVTTQKLAGAVQATIALLSNYIDLSALVYGSQTSLVVPDAKVMVSGTLVSITGSTLSLNTAANWDSATYATASNRAGKDFYLYALQSGGVIFSNNSTYPTGYTASDSRKIGGFHCLSVAVGTISGHTLTGYAAGRILPRSVWDLFNKSSARQEGTIYSRSGVWVDIYLPSVSGSTLVSVNGGTIADGTSSPAFHCYKFEQWFARQGMKTISQLEFFAASEGANQGTNIAGSADPGTTTGHTDTAGRRMISNEGVEDACGALWQWCRDIGGTQTAASYANAFDGNDSGVGGQHYAAPARGFLGGGWSNGAICGSRGSYWDFSPLVLNVGISARGVAEPARFRF